jgi:hypothetical protein
VKEEKMTRKRYRFLFLLVAFLFFSDPAQADMIIRDVSVTPLSPTTQDSVTAIISGTLASTLDSVCFEDNIKYNQGKGSYHIDIHLSHVVPTGTAQPGTFDFQLEVPLGQLEEGSCELYVVTQHMLLGFPPVVYSTLDALFCFAVSCTCTTSVSEEETAESAEFALHQNYPNPFNQSTKIGFVLAKSGFVSLDIYDILGRKVRNLVSGNSSSGYASVLWNGKNDSGKDVASGIYFYQVKAGDFSVTKTLVLLK